MIMTPKKILLMGLAGAGKTSILHSLRGEKKLTTFTEISATRGIDRVAFQALNSEFFCFDFGGQQSYIDQYLADFHKHIVGTSKLIFVIDVQAPEKYDPALEYLRKVSELLEEQEEEIDVVVFLHKWDPDIHQIIKDGEIESLLKAIKDIFPSGLSVEIAKTSIRAVFEKSTVF